jgi:predicted amidohydrolase
MVEHIPVASAAMHVVHDRGHNLERIHAFMGQAAAAGARLLVLPEGSLQGFIFRADGKLTPTEAAYHQKNAETVPGPSTDIICEWARLANLYVVFGMFEWQADALFNTAVLIGPQGYLGKYRKIHQPTEELPYYIPGDAWQSFDTPIGHLGLMICYDQCFPESARELALRGADVLAIPNAWAAINVSSQDRYDLYGRARAAENRCWVIQSNQVGRCGEMDYIGCSRIIDPNGRVIASTDSGAEGLAIAPISHPNIDPSESPSHIYLRQRKPGMYSAMRDFGGNL